MAKCLSSSSFSHWHPSSRGMRNGKGQGFFQKRDDYRGDLQCTLTMRICLVGWKSPWNEKSSWLPVYFSHGQCKLGIVSSDFHGNGVLKGQMLVYISMHCYNFKPQLNPVKGWAIYLRLILIGMIWLLWESGGGEWFIKTVLWHLWRAANSPLR